MSLATSSINSMVFLIKKTALAEHRGEYIPTFIKSQLISWIDLIDPDDKCINVLKEQIGEESFDYNNELNEALIKFLGEELLITLKNKGFFLA